ncbi:hypothetical protein HYX08_02125 [Candidatus Woesearchaeota archaeon]|nr:hypothetical protein [Candidatus Woesearchaeota archaeon]
MRYQILLALAVLLIVSCTPVQQGSGTPQPSEPAAEKSAQLPPKQISPEVRELFDKSAKIKSIYYKYRGPETGTNFHEFYIKGSKIKYNPYLEIKTLDRQDSYDSIFIDKEAKAAASYCTAAHCLYKGKKADLEYSKAYIPTVFDWADAARAEKIGEEVIDDRSTWKIDSDKGILWIDTFYGIPLKAESGGNTYRFQQISVNSVQDSDVVPS